MMNRAAACAAVPLVLADCKLLLTLGPPNQEFVVSHWGGDTFTFALEGENALPGTISEARFAGNTCTLEYYNHDNLGTFTR